MGKITVETCHIEGLKVITPTVFGEIAPTYPSLDEVETASELRCVCVRLAVVEKLLAEQA